MAVHCGLGKQLAKHHDQVLKRSFLCLRTGVFGLEGVEVSPSDVAYSYAGLVVVLAMCSGFFDGATQVKSAVSIDDIMVADGAEAACFVPAGNVRYGEVATLRGGAAMDDDFCDFSHKPHLASPKGRNLS